MKTRLLFLVIVFSIIVMTYFVSEYFGTYQKNNNLKTNCATSFDMMYESRDDDDSIPFTSVLQGQTFLANSFQVDKCATNVSEWAYLSENEDVIWNYGLNWNEISYIGIGGDKTIIYV